jgi:hypothetical protein
MVTQQSTTRMQEAKNAILFARRLEDDYLLKNSIQEIRTNLSTLSSGKGSNL